MATAQDLIDSSLRALNVLASGEVPTANERADGLITLNQLISSLSAEGAPIPYLSQDSFSLTGSSNYPIGTGLAINTPRPLLIRNASITVSGILEEMRIVTVDEWRKVEDYTRGGKFAEVLFYNVTSPTVGHIYMWPTPATGGVLDLWSYKPMAQLASLATTITMPEGYERALRTLLALELASEYGAPAPETLLANAQSAKAAIVGLNAAVLGTPPSQAQQEAQPAA